MNAFEKWQVIVLALQTVILLFTGLMALYIGLKQNEIGRQQDDIGLKQNEINERLRKLSDYVALTAVPSGDKIKLMNTGKQNLYLWGFSLPGNNQKLNRPRLIPAGTGDQAYYWIDPPAKNSVRIGDDFDVTVFLEDESGEKWVSEFGGKVGKDPIEMEINGKKEKIHPITLWLYRTKKENWN